MTSNANVDSLRVSRMITEAMQLNNVEPIHSIGGACMFLTAICSACMDEKEFHAIVKAMKSDFKTCKQKLRDLDA